MFIVCSKITARIARTIKFYKSQLNNIQQYTDPNALEKANQIKLSKPQYDRLIDFDTESMARLPWVFEPIEPIIDAAKQLLINLNQMIGLPWPMVIMASCVFMRCTILPLMYIQIKRMSRLAPLSPVLIHLKDAFKNSDLPLYKRGYLAIQTFRSILKQQNLQIFRTFIYNIIHFPIMITMIYTIRKLLAEPEVGSTSFLHLTQLSNIDPYFILPTLTIILHYYNFQRFITKQNANTILSKIRSTCQILLILWFPWLCSWPSGIVLYMCTNAFLSTMQTSIMINPMVTQKMNPKMLYYSFMLNKVQYDQKNSTALTEAIKTGSENLSQFSIQQETIVEKATQLIKFSNSQLEKQRKRQEQNDQDNLNKSVQQNQKAPDSKKD